MTRNDALWHKKGGDGMILYMIDTQGRARIAEFVRNAIAWSGKSTSKVGSMPGSPSRETIHRILRGDEQVHDDMLMALGVKLDLPLGFLGYIGTGDVRRIKESGASPDVIRWTLDLLESDPPKPENGPRSATG